MSVTPPEIADAHVEPLLERYGEKGVLELTSLIAWENWRARTNTALAIAPGGFSEGKVCVRATTPARPGPPRS